MSNEHQDYTLKERVEKLLSMKSLVTILLTIVFSYLAVIGTITAEKERLQQEYLQKKAEIENG